MSILINEDTQVLVQGITGRDGSFHTRTMIKDGTKIVAGVTPQKGGQKMDEIPVYDSVSDALKEHRIDATVIFVPPKFANNAIIESANEGIPLIICITEGVPVNEMLDTYHYVRSRGIRLIGPNCPGIISPGKSKIGIMPLKIHREGRIAVISRSGTLTYEVVHELSTNDLGQSTCVGIGGDPVVGSSFVDLLTLFNDDSDTDAIIMIGEIGGEDEEAAAEYIKQNVSKPVAGFISGRTAPPGKRMGHAGAIISGGKGTPEAKVKALMDAGVSIANTPSEIPSIIKQLLM